ncbi:MAG: DUF4352 domain-containing protein [Mycobacterium sp.]|nr:DUF4352 domain-containing protein [Mycobacterium sp.]
MTTSAKVAAGVGGTLAVAMLAFTALTASPDDDKTTRDRAPAAVQSAGAIGSQVRDGKFAFVVESVERQTNWYGDPKPRGQWVIATVRVTNIGAEPQSFFARNQKLIDAAGREYAGDGSAAIFMGEESMAVDLGPGLALSVRIPFDVPPSATLSALMLHDSVFSSGVRVSI